MPTILTNRKGQQTEERYSEHEAIDRLAKLVATTGPADDFPRDLCRRGQRSWLSPEQMWWVHKILNDRERPAQAGPASIPSVGKRMIEMFDRAAEHLKFPKIRFADVHFVRAGERSKHPGSITVTSAHPDREQRAYFGRIQRDGSFVQGQYLDSIHRARILEILADPAELAGIQGRECGSCCFCSRPLTDARSTSVGYGPICAEHFGLPWGEASSAFGVSV